MAVIISSHKSTVAMMNSIHTLLSENHPCTSFMASLRSGHPRTQHIITSTVDGGAGSAQFDFLTVVEWTGVGDTGRTGKVLWRCTGDVSTGKFFSSLLSSGSFLGSSNEALT